MDNLFISNYRLCNHKNIYETKLMKIRVMKYTLRVKIQLTKIIPTYY